MTYQEFTSSDVLRCYLQCCRHRDDCFRNAYVVIIGLVGLSFLLYLLLPAHFPPVPYQPGKTSRAYDTSVRTLRGIRPDADVVYYDYQHRPHINVSRNTCTQVSFASSPLPITALASIAGSGNTWARHLIELITGVYTGSVYHAYNLSHHFPGENRTNSSVVVYKTHRFKRHFQETGFRANSEPISLGTQRLVLMIRDPVDAAKAELQRELVHSQTGRLTTHVNYTVWNTFYSTRPHVWTYFHWYWLALARAEHLDVFVLFYKDLEQNQPQALSNLAHFLGAKLSLDILECAVKNSEGDFHRVRDSRNDVFEGVDTKVEDTKKARNFVNFLLRDCLLGKWCVTSGSKEL